MLKFETEGQEFRAGGTSLLTYLDTSYADLVRTFGEPGKGDENKTEAEWVIWFPDFEQVATIYDYKTGVAYCGEDEGTPTADLREWHVGGNDHAVIELVKYAIELGTKV